MGILTQNIYDGMILQQKTRESKKKKNKTVCHENFRKYLIKEIISSQHKTDSSQFSLNSRIIKQIDNVILIFIGNKKKLY